MPGTRCTVAACANSLHKTRSDAETQDIVYHTFPKTDEIRKQWIHRCKRDGAWNPKTSRICSVHFTVDDYERDLRAELLGLKYKRKILKKDAVPTLHLSQTSTEQPAGPSARSRRQDRRENKKTVQDLLETKNIVQNVLENENRLIVPDRLENENRLIVPDLLENENMLIVPDCLECENRLIVPDLLENENRLIVPDLLENENRFIVPDLLEDENRFIVPDLLENKTFANNSNHAVAKDRTNSNEALQDNKNEISLLQAKCKFFSNEVLVLKSKLNFAQRQANLKGMAMSQLKKELRALKRQQAKDSKIHTKLLSALKTVFSPAQLKVLIEKKKKVKWDDKSMAVAFSLRYLSRHAYQYMRKQMHYPLPGLSTLYSWASSFHVSASPFRENGIAEDELQDVHVQDCSTEVELQDVHVQDCSMEVELQDCSTEDELQDVHVQDCSTEVELQDCSSEDELQDVHVQDCSTEVELQDVQVQDCSTVPVW